MGAFRFKSYHFVNMVKRKRTAQADHDNHNNGEMKCEGPVDESCGSGTTMMLRPLPEGFVPGDNDVIWGRGKAIQNHPGNRFYRETIEHFLSHYAKADCKLDKSLIVSSVIAAIRDAASPSCGFVREENGRWFEPSELVIRERIGASLRDLLHNRYSSSSPSKQKRRKEVRDKLDDELEERMQHQDCKEIVTRMRRLAHEIEDDDKLQTAFNEANKELLEALKRAQSVTDTSRSCSERTAETRRSSERAAESLVDMLSSYILPADSDDANDLEPIPYDCTRN